MSSFPFNEIEKKWIRHWDEHKTNKVTEDPSVPDARRLYVLDMFPYPSGEGLHVGHPEGYTATDIYSRYKKMNGFNVLHPMGFDAYGLPAENYAIKTGTHPAETTRKNIDRFRTQIKSIGFCYDWDREVSTCDPDYYKWTQWIFLQLYKKGLAYESEEPINWCPKCATGLANEEVRDGRCDRCESPIERRRIRQWVLKITAYAERLLKDLDLLDWSESIKHMQKNWIGRSEGAEVDFIVEGSKDVLRVFTTRPDTLFGATYMVLAPEHPLVAKITTPDRKTEVEKYVKEATRKSDLQRTDLNKEKTGVFTGGYAVNPVNSKKTPVWISDYVLLSYGTGAIMAVPGHDGRDFEFATKFKLPIVQVVSKDGTLYELKQAETGDGISVNSGKFDGLKTAEFKASITRWLEENGKGKAAVNYKLRDWVFSRQRYWGEPIPLVHCKKCGIVPVDEKDLPLTLPAVKNYKPTGTGEPPLAAVTDWVETKCPKCGGPGKRETNTMPQWAGSCWYYLRFTDPKNSQALAARDKIDYWTPVDLYIGGAEHAVLHLLYARFWHKVLFDIGIVNSPEPFMSLRNQGMILAENGEKMSKSRGNVINPDAIVQEYGADTLRLYEMFLGPLSAEKPWKTQGIQGPFRFLERVWRLLEKQISVDAPVPDELEKIRHKTIKLVGERIEALEFNTAISQLMIFVNEILKGEKLNSGILKDLVLLLHPFAPFITEEMWERIGGKPSVLSAAWPSFDPAKTTDDTVNMVVQVNGKIRDTIPVAKTISKEEMERLAMASEKVRQKLEGQAVVKVVVVPGKLVNIVVRQS